MKQVQGLPELRITLAGRRLADADLAAVVQIQVRGVLASPTQCLLTLQPDETRQVRSRTAPRPGDGLRIEVGRHRDPLFSGEITVVEHAYGADASREVRVRAYDLLHRPRKRHATRMHDDVDLTSLASALVAGTGLTVQGGGRRAGHRLGRVYQCARSDLELLIEQAARVALFPVVEQSTLRFVGLEGQGDEVELELGASLHSAEIEVSQEPSFRTVETVRWDPSSAASGSGMASDHGARASVRADPDPSSVGGGGVFVRADEVTADLDAPDALSQAELDVRSAGEVVATLVAEGDPRLRPGSRVRVRGVAAPLEGSFTVTEAVHVIDGSGYETTVSTRPPAGPAPRPRDLVTLGVVSDAEDPESRGRVQVRLVAYPDLMTDWAPVVIAGAGAGKGLVAVPGLDDPVLVLLPAGDPANAIVLGGLYGPEQVPDQGVAGARGGRFTVQTADGQRVVLDSDARTVTLDDGHGSSVELGPELLRITAATDLVLEAPGRALRIRASTVDFEQAQ